LTELQLQKKLDGVVFGTAIGDALGWPVEFMSMCDIHARYGDEGVRDFESAFIGTPSEVAAGPMWSGPACARYTDDTQMMRAVLEGLIRARPQSKLEINSTAEEVAAEFIDWANSPENNRAPGASCMYGCRQLEAGVRWEKAGKEGSKGCGAAMRAMAYGVWFWENPEIAAEYAAAHALMTHRSAEAQASAAAVAAGTARAIMGYPLEAIWMGMRDFADLWDASTAELIYDAAVAALHRDIHEFQILDQWRGWTGAEAVAAALFCFLRAEGNYVGAVLRAVNSPGDSDSLGAIAGALAGGHGGVFSIPEKWRHRIEKSFELNAYSSRVCRARGMFRREVFDVR